MFLAIYAIDRAQAKQHIERFFEINCRPGKAVDRLVLQGSREELERFLETADRALCGKIEETADRAEEN